MHIAWVVQHLMVNGQLFLSNFPPTTVKLNNPFNELIGCLVSSFDLFAATGSLMGKVMRGTLPFCEVE